jgi:glycosyltransferase involved in cell wall biosynthesis
VTSLKYFSEKVLPKIRKAVPVSLHVIGRGWSWDKHRFLRHENILVRGPLSDVDLQAAYRESALAVGILLFGAGVKGKIIEAMENGVPVIANSIGKEGISCKALLACDELEQQVDVAIKYLTDTQYCKNTVSEYRRYLSDNYSQINFRSALGMMQ